MRNRAVVLAAAFVVACAKDKPAADTSAVTIPLVAPETIKAAPAAPAAKQPVTQKVADSANVTSKTGTKTLLRDSVRAGPIGVLPADTKKKPL